MINFIKYRSASITVFFILLCVFLFTKCINNQKNKEVADVKKKFESFAGSSSCISCHKSIYDNHVNTAHFKTSAVALAKNILGSFEKGKNTFAYNSGGIIAMEKRGEGFYQIGYVNNTEKKAQRFDIIIGSGTKGQSYASWVQNKLVQLPVTYFTSLNKWCNSPGYPNKMAFNRPVTSRCLECHTTFAEKITADEKEPEEFDKNRIILGVDCEKCHGPAAKHVEYQTQNPAEAKGKFILNPASFSRQQSLDLCAVCHGGRLQKTKPSFQFTAGNKLADYFLIDSTGKDAANIDVHGNQYGLMAASKCFKNSKTLTCITCHNSHENEKEKTVVFSQRCLTCHAGGHNGAVVCKLKITGDTDINKNCAGCHMPQQPSRAIAVLLQGEETLTPALMHTHLIKIYPEETQKILAFLKTK